MSTEGKSLLSRDMILSAIDLPTMDVKVPEWGGVVRVRALTGTERDRFESSMVTDKDDKKSDKFANVRARMCAMTIVGEDGVTSLFSEEDIVALGKKSAKALNRVFDAARKLSGFSEDDVKELEKN